MGGLVIEVTKGSMDNLKGSQFMLQEETHS